MFKLILDHVVGIFLLAFLLYSFYWNLTRLGSFLACFKVKNCVNNNCVFSGVCPKWEESYTEDVQIVVLGINLKKRYRKFMTFWKNTGKKYEKKNPLNRLLTLGLYKIDLFLLPMTR